MKKRSISILLAAALVLLAACSAVSAPADVTDAPRTAVEEPTPSAEASAEPAGQTEAPETPAPAAEPVRQDGERFDAVITVEGMEETVHCEHIVNKALGFEMDYDYERFVRQSEADRERFVSSWEDAANPENYIELTYIAKDSESIAASVRESLSKTYDLTEESRKLDRAGGCLYLEASVLKGTDNMADRLQLVYIIPASDGCIVAAEYLAAEASEGFGRRFAYMLNTLAVTERNAAETTPAPTTPPAEGKAPTITKSPTDETVTPGGTAVFIAHSENATRTEWHFVNSDRSQDLTYTEAAQKFSGLKIAGGDDDRLTLSNIPENLSGWSVYCHYSNAAGSSDTDRALITVSPPPTPYPEGKAPTITKSPTGETVQAGGTAEFVARSEGATRTEWHFVNSDRSQDIDCTAAASKFSGLKITGGDADRLTLENIPKDLNGWSVYCHYSNAAGSADTDRALITVDSAPETTPAPTTPPAEGKAPTITKSPTGETVAIGGSAVFVAHSENATRTEWHFVNSDRSQDLDCTAAASKFSGLKITGGDADRLTLENIPKDLNGWSVYCHYSNAAGSADTDRALITVDSAPETTPAPTTPPAEGKAPTITKSPTGESVSAGGSAVFVAHSENATRTEWHFVNSDRTQDLDCTAAASKFSGLKITGGDADRLTLENIPEDLNGWSVYCHYSNAAGSADTDRALITVGKAGQTAFDYTGSFTESRASRGTLVITGSPELYEVTVEWHEGSSLYITTFSGVFSDTGILSYSNACLTVRFEDGSHELRYTGGTGKLAYVDSGVVGVYWTDDQSEYDEDNFFFAKD